MRSLRGRLVAILLLVAFAGLVVLAAITFAEQKSFLYDRVDRQVQQGYGAVLRSIAFAQQNANSSCTGTLDPSELPFGVNGPNGQDDTGGSDSSGSDDSSRGETPQPGNGPRDGGGNEPLNLPPGTYGAVVGPSGSVEASCTFGFGSADSYSTPDFSGVTLTRNPQTIPAKGKEDTEFRAAATQVPGGSLVVAVPLSETRDTVNRLVLVEAVVIAFVLLLLGVASWLLVGLGLKPLDKMGATADSIASGDLSQRVEPAESDSEIGRLGLALNRMLRRLEEAFKEREQSEGRLRQFLADASHELRTPLVSIRGYSELYRLGATPDEEEVKRSMARIEQESQRMGVLVEDMLTLARLDETHDHDLAPVDVATVARDAARDAEVSAPDREFTVDADGPLTVTGDAHQLHQVIANLLRNAIVHTPAGSPVEVLVTRSGDDVRIDVRDHGPGLPDGAGDKLFERFWRAEAGRERAKGGSGLGLAIVAEIVEAHGGRVHAKNDRTDGGAVFSVWLPLAERG